MKKLLPLFLVVIAFSLFNLQLFSQTNYYGMSGNMVTGDFDNDGLLDDISAFNTSGVLPVLTQWISHEGWMDETEANCQLPFDYLAGKSINSKIVAGDFDNDGFIDDIASIYEVGYNKTSLTVWINTDGVYTPQRWWYGADFDANQVAQTIVAGDFDHDGFVDDIAAFYDYDQKQTKVYVWKSNGSKFSWPGTWWIGNDFNSTRIQGTMVAGDFDHDGYIDDIATLYDYSDDFCRVYVWTTKGDKFNWPYTWFEQENFAAGNAKSNVIAGDYNNNGFVDNIAALYNDGDNNSSIYVFERGKKGFDTPTIWWYGNDEAKTTNMRLVSSDINGNKQMDQIVGLSINSDQALLKTWTAKNNSFDLPENSWEGVALAIEDCENEGGCLANYLAEDFKLYPNPNNGQFVLDIPNIKDTEVEITIYNVLGSQVMQFNANCGFSVPVSMTEFESGTYMVKISGTDFTVNQNFVIK